MYRETLEKYRASYEERTAKIEWFDKRIEEIVEQERYQEKVKRLGITKAGNIYLRLLLAECICKGAGMFCMGDVTENTGIKTA